MDKGHPTEGSGHLSRADRRLLNRLNCGIDAGAPRSAEQLDRLIDSGFVKRNAIGELSITSRGQLALARWRFRNLPKPRMVIVSYNAPRNIWQRLFG